MKRAKKTRTFTLEEHAELGEALKNCRKTLMDAAIRVPNTYGFRTPAARLAEQALKALDALRCELDNRVCSEQPMPAHGSPDRILKIYYGRP